MAVIKTIRKGVDPKTGKVFSDTAKSMQRLVEYCMDPRKTTPENIFCLNCSPNTAFEEMWLTKEIFNKQTNKRLFHHYEQSFPPHEITPAKATAIGKELLETFPGFKNFQVVMGTHLDKEHLHNHFCINSTNIVTGRAWDFSKQDLKNLKSLSLELCRKHDVYIHWDPYYKEHSNKNLLEMKPEEKNMLDEDREAREEVMHRTTCQGEYMAAQKGESWKKELRLAIVSVKKVATSQEDFINKMGALGYQVLWNHRKHITFTTPGGKKMRNDKFYKNQYFTKEALEKRFEKNRLSFDDKKKTQKNREFNAFTGKLQGVTALLKSQGMDDRGNCPISNLAEFGKKGLEGVALREKMRESQDKSNIKWEEQEY